MSPRRLIAALGIATLAGGVTAPACLSTAAAQPVKGCIGNKAVATAPYICGSTRTIDGTAITVIIDVAADGTATVSYTLATPRPVDTPIRVRAHRGISSSGDVPNEAEGVIPAGQVYGGLAFTIRCGQVDAKAVFVGNGDARGRVAGPYITTGDDCQQVTSSTSPSTVPTTTPTGGSSSVPTSTPGTGPVHSVPGTIPATGSQAAAFFVAAALALLVGGGSIVVAARRRTDA